MLLCFFVRLPSCTPCFIAYHVRFIECQPDLKIRYKQLISACFVALRNLVDNCLLKVCNKINLCELFVFMYVLCMYWVLLVKVNFKFSKS